MRCFLLSFKKVLTRLWFQCPLFKLHTLKLSFTGSQGCSVAGNVHDHHFTKASFDLVFRTITVWKLCPIEHFTSFILSALCSHILIRLKFVLQLAFIKVYSLQQKSPLSCASKLCLKFKMKWLCKWSDYEDYYYAKNISRFLVYLYI